MATVTIYHNPSCSNSRGALALLRERGIEPAIVEYLKTPPTRAQLAALAERLGTVAGMVRTKEPLYAELGLAAADDDALLDAMAAHPILINRPIVVTEKGARLCRPPELVLDLL